MQVYIEIKCLFPEYNQMLNPECVSRRGANYLDCIPLEHRTGAYINIDCGQPV